MFVCSRIVFISPKTCFKNLKEKKKIQVWTEIYSMREVRNGANISPCHKAGMDTDWERSRWCSIWCNVSDRENYLFIVGGDLLWQVASRYLINLLCWCISHESKGCWKGAWTLHSVFISMQHHYDIDFEYNDTKESNRLGVEQFVACSNCNCRLSCKHMWHDLVNRESRLTI